MKYYSILLALLFLSAFPENSLQSGKHLIIMSGQSNMVHLNPKLTFLPSLKEEFGIQSILIVKDAKGTQPISRWYKKATTNSKEKQIGDLYDKLLQKVEIAQQGVLIESITFIWMQGERDAKLGNANVYEDYLKGLYKQFSEDLKRDDINFIIGRLNDFDMSNKNWKDWTKIRDIQVKVAESNSRFDWVDTDDFNTGIGLNGKRVDDDIHMSKTGYLCLGKAFAEKAIKLIKSQN